MSALEFLTKEDATKAYAELTDKYTELESKYDQAVQIGQRYQTAYGGLAAKLNAMKLILSAPTEGG